MYWSWKAGQRTPRSRFTRALEGDASRRGEGRSGAASGGESGKVRSPAALGAAYCRFRSARRACPGCAVARNRRARRGPRRSFCWTAWRAKQSWLRVGSISRSISPLSATALCDSPSPPTPSPPTIPRSSVSGARRGSRRLASRSERPNIVLISLDTLRADHLSLYGYERQTSPNLDAWVRERHGTVFRQVVPSSGWTLPSHFSLFTGLDSFRHPANYNNVAIDSAAFGFLAEHLLAEGYRTQAFTGGGFVHPIYGLAKGFESFAYWSSKERRAEELESNLERAGKWLDSLGFFQTGASRGAAVVPATPSCSSCSPTRSIPPTPRGSPISRA